MNNNPIDDEVFENMKTTWQTFDLQQERNDWQTRQQKDNRAFALEMFISGSLVSIGVTMIIMGQLSIQALGLILFVFGLFNTTYEYKLRQKKINEMPSQTGEFIKILKQNNATQLKNVKTQKMIVVILGIIITGWASWHMLLHEQLYRANPWSALLSFGGIIAILVGVFVHVHLQGKKLKKEAIRLNEIDAQFTT